MGFAYFSTERDPMEVREMFGLLAPYKQCMFAVGMLLTTPNLCNGRYCSDEDWKGICDLLNAIFMQYSCMFWPTPEELPHVTQEWHEHRNVMMPAFLEYFTGGELATTHQLKHRVEDLFIPFDRELETRMGISATDALRVVDACMELERRRRSLLSEASVRHAQLVEVADEERWTTARLIEEAKAEPLFADAAQALRNILRLHFTELEAAVDKKCAAAFWQAFTACRGQVGEFTYLTERNPADTRPLILLSDGVAMLPNPSTLLLALHAQMGDTLVESHSRERFYRRRSAWLEERAERTLERLFGSTAEYYRNVYETSTAHHEHDLVIRWRDSVFVVEAKASARKAPFRDPDIAFERIRQEFRSDRGIQSAFEQARRIARPLQNGQDVILFDEDGAMQCTLEASGTNEVYSICLTADRFGIIGTNLTLLMEKGPDDKYPLAVNIFDLEAFIEGLLRKGWGPAEFCRYLQQRRALHGWAITADELDIAGMFLKFGTLEQLLQAKREHPNSIIQLDNSGYADVFDEIYLEQHGGPLATLEPKSDMILTDLTELGRELKRSMYGSTDFGPGEKGAVGRNRPCPCGSGKKYKRCCGQSNPRGS